MSSRPGTKWRRLVSVRLALWYALITGVSLLAVALLFYVNFERAQQRSDRDWIKAKLGEFAAEFQEGGLPALKALSQERRSASLFIRVLDRENFRLFQSVPDEWTPEHTARLDQVLAGGMGDWMEVEALGEDFELARASLPQGQRLLVGRSTHAREVALQRIQMKAWQVILPALVLCLGGGVFIAHRALKPLRGLQAAVEEIIASGKFEARLSPGKTADELAELVCLFNAMLDRIQALIRGMRECLDTVAHDLRTPLTHLRGLAELALQEGASEPALREALVACLEESGHLTRMLATLMDISEAEHGAMRLHLEPIDAWMLVAEVANLYEHVAEDKGVALRIEGKEGDFVVGDRMRLIQVISNLIGNAHKYTPPGGWVTAGVVREGDWIRIEVRDSGVGIPADQLSKVWERLYRCDHSRTEPGLGLGLSLVRAITKAHGGTATVESAPEMGSTFSLFLPVAPQPESRAIG